MFSLSRIILLIVSIIIGCIIGWYISYRQFKRDMKDIDERHERRMKRLCEEMQIKWTGEKNDRKYITRRNNIEAKRTD